MCYNPFANLKHVVSVSLGSAKRNKTVEATLFGEPFRIERIGTDGDLDRFAALFRELDGKVDALGIGGADMYLWLGDRRYTFRQIRRLVSGARITPVVDGSGLKNSLERQAVYYLQEHRILPLSGMNAFLVMAVDRFGMAQALANVCARTVFGDVIFGLGLPIPIRGYGSIKLLGSVMLPVITRLPFQWFYPTGAKQETRQPKARNVFDWADLIAGDWHYIRRYMPDVLPGKVILTNTIRKADLDLLRGAGVRTVVTTTPQMDGESFGTNVMEGVLVALLGRRPEELTDADYTDALARLGWRPTVTELESAGVA